MDVVGVDDLVVEADVVGMGGSVVEEDEAAKFEVMKLLAEMEAMDKESERLKAILELEQMKSMLVAVSAVAGDATAVAHVRGGLSASADEPVSPESVMEEANSPSPPRPDRAPRQSNLSEIERERLGALLAEDVPREEGCSTPVRSSHDQTSTLRMLTAHSQTSSGGGGGVLPELAQQMLAEAQRAFQPDATEMAAEIARMEAELRALTLQRDLQQQQMELARLTALLDEAEEPRITEVAEVEEGDSAGEQEHDAANVD